MPPSPMRAVTLWWPSREPTVKGISCGYVSRFNRGQLSDTARAGFRDSRNTATPSCSHRVDCCRRYGLCDGPGEAFRRCSRDRTAHDPGIYLERLLPIGLVPPSSRERCASTIIGSRLSRSAWVFFDDTCATSKRHSAIDIPRAVRGHRPSLGCFVWTGADYTADRSRRTPILNRP